jgi:hypothetical protein
MSTWYTAPFLLALQPCVGLCILHFFVIVDFSGVGSLAPRPTPICKTRSYTSFGMGGTTRSLRSRQHSYPDLHDKAVALEKTYYLPFENTTGIHNLLYRMSQEERSEYRSF